MYLNVQLNVSRSIWFFFPDGRKLTRSQSRQRLLQSRRHFRFHPRFRRSIFYNGRFGYPRHYESRYSSESIDNDEEEDEYEEEEDDGDEYFDEEEAEEEEEEEDENEDEEENEERNRRFGIQSFKVHEKDWIAIRPGDVLGW